MKAIVPSLLILATIGCREAAPPSTAQVSSPAPSVKPSDGGSPIAKVDAGPPELAPLKPAEQQAGQQLVVNNCAHCHTEQILEQQRLTTKQWEAVIKKMQGWGSPLEPENTSLLIRYASARFGLNAGPYQAPMMEAKAAALALVPQRDGAFTKGSPAKGKALYTTRCASCHGADARGAPLGVNLVDVPVLYRAVDFASVVRRGKGRMPLFEASNSEIGSMLAHLRTLRQ